MFNRLISQLFPNPYGNQIDPQIVNQLMRQSLMGLGANMISNPTLANLFPSVAQTSGNFQAGLGDSYEIALKRAEEARKASMDERRYNLQVRDTERLERDSEANMANRDFDNELALQKYINEVTEKTKTEEGVRQWLDTIENPQQRAFAETAIAAGTPMSTIAGRIFDIQNPKPKQNKPLSRNSGSHSWLETVQYDEEGNPVGVSRVPGSTVKREPAPSNRQPAQPKREYKVPASTPSLDMINSRIRDLMRPPEGADEANWTPPSREEATRQAEEYIESLQAQRLRMDAARNADKIARDLSDRAVLDTIPPEETAAFLSIPEVANKMSAGAYVTAYYLKIADAEDKKAIEQIINTMSDPTWAGEHIDLNDLKRQLMQSQGIR